MKQINIIKNSKIKDKSAQMMISRNSPTPDFTSTKFHHVADPIIKRLGNGPKQLSHNSNPQQISQLEYISKQLKQKMLPLPQLLDRLSLYRSLKQIQQCIPNQNSQKLWRDSPCCIPYSNKNICIDQVRKFQIGSIYHKDNINQQKKVFTQFEKPQLLLKNFKRQIQQASRSRQKSINKKNSIFNSNNNTMNNTFNNINHKRTLSLRKVTKPLDSKCYQVPQKIQLKYDRNGTRSIHPGEYDIKQIKNKIRIKKNNFTSSQRIDLALPLNFNPGPGRYFFKQHEKNNHGNYTYREKRNSKINEHIDMKDSVKTERNHIKKL